MWYRYKTVNSFIYDISDKTHVQQTPSFLPETATYAYMSCDVTCRVPKSIEYLTVDAIGEGATFERNPGELEVSVGNVNLNEECKIVHSSYITHLRDHRDHDKSLINLRSMYVPFGAEYDATALLGVNIQPYEGRCHHFRIRPINVITGNMWSGYECCICGKVDSYITKDGTVCQEMKPCESLSIENLTLKKTKVILGLMSPETEKVTIVASVDQMNEFCKDGILDLIPRSVKHVVISLVPLSYMHISQPAFVGVSKRYPFRVSVIATMRRSIGITDFAYIDTCGTEIFPDYKKREATMREYKRLSVAER